MNDLRGRVAIVTGGAQGIGHAICMALAREGTDVVVADMNLAGARQSAKEASALAECRGHEVPPKRQQRENMGSVEAELI